MKIAIGNDLVYLPEFKKSLTAGFRQRVFTQTEIKQIEEYKAHPLARYATTWAAKEAVFKALQQLFKRPLGLNWKEIEILRNGKIPSVEIKKTRFRAIFFSLSLSHEKDYASAVVLASLMRG